LSLAEVVVPRSAVNKSHADIDGLLGFDTYPAVFALLAIQLLEVLLLKVINRLVGQVF